MIKVIQGDVTTLAVDAIVNAESRAGGEEVFISRGGAEKMRWKSFSAVSRSGMRWCITR